MQVSKSVNNFRFQRYKFCTQILFLCEIIFDETREMKGKIETITSVYISEETRIAPWLTSDLWRGLQVSGRM